MSEESTMVLGIFGWPVAHSRSPAMHNAAAAALGLDLAYVPFAVRPEGLAAAVAGVRAMGIRGVNVTLPHKEHVIAHLDEITDTARAIGAVNTLVHEPDGRLRGDNTDAAGLVQSLIEAGVSLKGARVTILGAGGAARAAAVGIAEHGAARVTVAARRETQAEALAVDLQPALGDLIKSEGMKDVPALETLFAETDLVVQATSATLASSAHAESFAASLPIDALPDTAALVDLVYQPRTTTVMAKAEARGLRTVDGLGMLVHQGALAFTQWTGEDAPVDVMRRALEASL